MSKQDRIQARINHQLKEDVGEFLEEVGLDHSTLISMTYRHIQNHGRLPFTPHVPNDETEDAIEEVENKETESFDSIDDFLSEQN